jgi:hypothetical protein
VIVGNVRFTGLAAAEGTFSFISSTGVQLKAKAAFVDPKTGKTHGWTHTEMGWSKETLVALENLRTCIERDLSRVHFTEMDGFSADSETTRAGTPGGIGESLREDAEAPQV